MLKQNKNILLIILGALILRLVSITHGFPFIFHPDEPSLIRSAMGIKFNSNPGHFDWPHLQFYLNYGLYWLFIKFRSLLQILNLRPMFEGLFPLLWRDPLIFYLLSRVFSALMGVFTLIPVYLTGKYLFGERVGLYSALVLAITPFHVLTSHYALIDIPATFWIAWVVYFSSRIIYERNFHHYILAGLFVGFAASTKYNGGLIAIIVPLAHLFRLWHSEDETFWDRDGLLMLIYSGLFATLGFIIGTPYSILDFSTFVRTDSPLGAFWQFKNVGKVGFVTKLTQFFHNIVYKLSDDFGYTILIAYFASALSFVGVLVDAVVENKRKKITHSVIKLGLLFIPSLFMFFYISGFEKTRSHYYLITYPLVAVVAGYVLNNVVSFLEKKKKTLHYIKPFFITFFIFPVFFTFSNILELSRDDTRVVLYKWLLLNTQNTDYLAYDSNELRPVFLKFNSNNVDKVQSPLVEQPLNGYLIINQNALSEENDAYYNITYAEVLDITRFLRKGPPIKVYKL